MIFCGSFCQVLLCVLAKFRSPPNPLIAGVRFLSDEKPDSKGHLQSIGTAHENDCSPRQKARR